MPELDFAALRRYPDIEAENLFAHDAADRLLLDTAAEALAGCAPGRLAVVGDDYGALALGAAAGHGGPGAPWQPAGGPGEPPRRRRAGLAVGALAAADEGELMAAWAGLGYYARARNLIACARVVVAQHDGRFPNDEAGLRALPGIGRYTAAAIAAIAFGRRAVVVDANVE
ncbi:MAG: hypothetical protein ACLGI6_24040, partial [Gammaproteobacteria bacterium]